MVQERNETSQVLDPLFTKFNFITLDSISQNGTSSRDHSIHSYFSKIRKHHQLYRPLLTCLKLKTFILTPTPPPITTTTSATTKPTMTARQPQEQEDLFSSSNVIVQNLEKLVLK